MKKIQLLVYISLVITCFIGGCKKQDEFIDAIPQSSLAVPSTLNDLELMCLSQNVFNVLDPGYPTISSERYFLSDVYYSGISLQSQAAYLWSKNMQFIQTFSFADWNGPYQQVLTTNIVLEKLGQIKYGDGEKAKANAIKGMALFYRSWAFFNLVSEFAMPYDSSKGNSQLGIPLRVNSAQEIPSTRATLKETYDRIINDTKEAITLLPSISANVATPNSLIAKGFLARVYLALGDYRDALELSNSFLQQFNTITDYNTLVPTSSAINSSYLSEDVYHVMMISWDLSYAGASQVQTDSNFYKSYDSNDLRKDLFFTISPSRGTRYFRGSYDMYRGGLYTGIATDEMLLIRAECNARLGNPSAALDDINKLLRLRYLPGTFQDYTTSNTPDVLGQVLIEREKELYMRGLRWNDLRRLNRDPARAVTLQRTINGTVYQLPPNDPRYALSIPDQEILLSGIQQNPR